ncbi:nonsense-mediated mRNA decay protein [Aaosphaeria arxii CBS 175.79]|uniref:60S ribosomal export protein NMD3 n=1 Tax=Aaosphaeria arxii CBS 175.79 TaxID=1450172 RepID=A0A6A5XB07_9PLEO|nr:nonsense-mediated mRNA decay protein [Aaosphaeria arxii CBS 175.79]KAF2010026.1 nonsense-mediated mRNA decay protein [Aaosphaeria arxii CBS 175.79]
MEVFTPAPRTAATILCADCGAPVDGTISGAFCIDCIKLKTDVTSGIQREGTLHMCRDCDRWLSPPNTWVVASLESRELLALCLRKLRGLNKLRIIDASFIWTEPHSRRIKMKITVQSELGSQEGAIFQQTFEVEFVQNYQQCPDCQKSFTPNTWRASVQVRQHVPHKRTFLFLEQLILKHSAHKDTINIKEVHEGIDFYFAQRNQADAFVDFLKAVVPVNVKKSQELISMDVHTSTKSYKFSYSVELVPICKDDLVALPIPMAKKLGNISPLTLCHRIGTSINLIDPITLQTADVSTEIYWRAPFKPLADVQDLTEFIILDIEPLGPSRGRLFLAEATVARAADMGANDQTFYTRTHLGGILNVGDSVMGYSFTGTNFNNPLFDALEESKYASKLPDVVLVKKHYARKKKGKSRNWRVKRMAKEESEMLPRKQDQERMERDFEMFLRDVEEDSDLRAGVALYKAEQQRLQDGGDAMDVEESDAGDEDEGLEIPMDQLLDDFEDMTMQE